MGTMKYEKRIRGVRPAPMLAEVTQVFGPWGRSPHLVIGYIRGVVHRVRNVMVSGSEVIELGIVRISPGKS